jgi:hypothetical protein
MMIIEDIKEFQGQHCETTATGTLLRHAGLELSEPMLFGLGEGLYFVYWKMKEMNLPFLGGRCKTWELTENLCRNLGLILDNRETTSVKKAWKNVQEFIDQGIPVGLQLDSYYLEYFTKAFHFAGHFLAMYGYDDTHAYVVDTIQQGGKNTTLLNNLEKARKEKGPMAAKNRSYTVTLPDELPDMKTAVTGAMKRNAEAYLNPPIKNFAYKGIEKLSKEVLKWLQIAPNPAEDLGLTAMLMEKAGTGGAIFRNLYRDFLKEAVDITTHPNVEQAYTLFCDVAPKWNQVSALLTEAGEKENQAHLKQVSELLKELAALEKQAMEYLAELK